MTIGIIGLGLIGASYAAGLKAAGYTVFGYDTSKTVMKKAYADEIIEGDALERLQMCDILVLALLPKDNVHFIETQGVNMVAGQLLTDVAGVKGPMMTSIESLLPKGVHYLSHHPMAGNPKGGYANHSKSLFEEANAILVEGSASIQASKNQLSDILKALGMRRTVCMDAKMHDAFIAHTSQLTHLISSALILSGEASIPIEASGNSYRDLTRIGDIEPDLWTPLFMENKASLLKTLKTFETTLEQYRKSLETNDSEGVRDMLEKTRKAWRTQKQK